MNQRLLKQTQIIILLFILAAGCASPPSEPADPVSPADAAVADRAAPQQQVPTSPPLRATTILAEGALQAVNPQMSLGFATTGRLLDLHVSSGDHVNAGDLIATLDDKTIRETVTDAELGLRQAENSLAQAQLSLDNLLSWEPDETAVAQAEASLAAAEANLSSAKSQDAASGYSVTSARIALEQAEQAVVDANKAYETAFDPGRDWEQFIDDPSCLTGQQFPLCTGPPYSDVIEAERNAAERAIPAAEDQLEVARANYNLAVAGLDNNSAASAEANIASARQALEAASRGPQPQEIAAARLQVAAAELAVEQAQITAAKAIAALEDSSLVAPWTGTVLSVEAAPGALLTAGTPVVTLLDTAELTFHTSNLSERDLAEIVPGLRAQITLKAYPQQPLDGRVQRIAPIASGSIGDAATFTVIIAVDAADLDLLPGMTGRVEILRD